MYVQHFLWNGWNSLHKMQSIKALNALECRTGRQTNSLEKPLRALRSAQASKHCDRQQRATNNNDYVLGVQQAIPYTYAWPCMHTHFSIYVCKCALLCVPQTNKRINELQTANNSLTCFHSCAVTSVQFFGFRFFIAYLWRILRCTNYKDIYKDEWAAKTYLNHFNITNRSRLVKHLKRESRRNKINRQQSGAKR